MGLSGAYSLDEIARAAGVTEAQARALAHGNGPWSAADAVALGRALVAQRRGATLLGQASLFDAASERLPHDLSGVPLALSGSLHVGALATIAFALSFHATAATTAAAEHAPRVQLIFFAIPGPGGGGGGGGRFEKAPPSRAAFKGHSEIASPAPPPAAATATPLVPVEPAASTIVTPIVSAPDGARDRVGVLEQIDARDESASSGRGGGAGTGAGTGIGEGDGAGVGPGVGGGFGGGAYRPGSGITPPRLVHEVKGDYTEEARRRGVTGEVLMEIVVRRDGSVGSVRLLHGLGLGLDERAIAAIRQWHFTPAEKQGVAVDVIVEAGMEFRLR
jgi:TonB family protein